MRAADLCIVGFGSAGRALVRLLGDRAADLPFRVVALVTAHHGWWVAYAVLTDVLDVAGWRLLA